MKAKIKPFMFLFLCLSVFLLVGCDKIRTPKDTRDVSVPSQINYVFNEDTNNSNLTTTNMSNSVVVAEIKIFDTNGYSTYIHSKGFNMLIDTGSENDFILNEVKKYPNLDYLIFTSNSKEKLGNAEIMLFKFKPKIFETGIKNLELDMTNLQNISNELNLSWNVLIEPLYVEDEYLKINILTPYNSGFFPKFDDNSMVIVVKTAKSSILLMPTCGMDCQEKSNLPLNNDFVLLPYKGSCEAIDLLDILKYSNNAVSVPSCNETKTKLEYLDYKLLDYPITIKIFDDGGVNYE